MSLLVVGSVAIDKVETPHGRVEEELGGSAVYFSFAAGFFSPVRLVGAVGEDFPPSFEQRLRARPIDLTGLRRLPGRTFRWHGAYEGRMAQARTVAVEMNVLEGFRPSLPGGYADSKFVFLANASPETHLAVLDQLSGPRFVLADTMNIYIERERQALLQVLERVDGLVLNDGEALMLSGEPDLLRASRWVCQRGPRWCIVKKGEHGSLLRGPSGVFVLPAYPHEGVVDPTGAGDAFAGGLMGYLAACGEVDEDTLKVAMAYGTVAASFAIERFGPAGLEHADQQAWRERLDRFVRATHLPGGQVRLRPRP